jgi:hypothetical protein
MLLNFELIILNFEFPRRGLGLPDFSSHSPGTQFLSKFFYTRDKSGRVGIPPRFKNAGLPASRHIFVWSYKQSWSAGHTSMT